MTLLPLDNPATYDDLHNLPSEARAEILDGVIVMSPGASIRHNRAARYLANLLEAAGRRHGYSVGTDNDVQWTATRVTRPDVFVIDTAHAETDPMPVTEIPVIVVEILSPTSMTQDLVIKPKYCETAKVLEYWVVDLTKQHLLRYHFIDDDTHYTRDIIQNGSKMSIDIPFPFVLDTSVIFWLK